MAKKIYNIHLIDQHYHDRAWSVVFLTVQDIAHRYHIKMPEVGIYTDDTPNAFATWAHKNAALVAVSTGLLHQMNEDEIKGVVAHEMAHILNGDMVTTTLLQWVLNTFVIFFARVLARLVDTALSKSDNDNGPSFLYYLIVWILEIGLGVLASLILFAHSRHREYKADEWSARMVGKQSMIAALEKLKILTRRSVTQVPQDEYATLKIFWWRSKWYLFQTHPDLDERITHLQKMV
jgi:heat shock protein HtpX